MKKNILLSKLIFLAIFILFYSVNAVNAQKNKDKQKETAEEEAKKETFEQYKNQAAQLIEYLQGTLNAIGSEYTPTYEKQIMINESYNKIFLDENVQVEDDLDENRQIYAYKDVQAYLQDIDFFFKKVEFKFKIDTIEQFYNSDEQPVFKVKTVRNLKGITISNDTINSFLDRYIEINLNEQEQSLKIVSFYSTKLNEADELKDWWKGLSSEWKNIFYKKLDLKEPVTYEQLKNVLKTTEIDISNNKNINNLNPLSKLSRLKKLNLSNTAISDLYPIRNLNKLEVLDCSNTKISTISHLQYASQLQDLYLDNTEISDLTTVENFLKLRKLSFENTKVDSIDAFIELSALEDLRFSNTKVTNTEALKELTNIKIAKFDNTNIKSLTDFVSNKNLELISFSKTKITDISPLKEMNKLKFIYFDSTQVNSLSEIENLTNLEAIYCDNSGIDNKKAINFIVKHPNTLVIFNSNELNNWWNEMPDFWKTFFIKDYLKNKPTKEQLNKLTLTKEIDISGKTEFTSIKTLEKLTSLAKLNISGTKVNELTALKALIDLQKLDCSKTEIIDLSPLSNLKKLDYLNCSNTKISNLSPLAKCTNLEIINADNTEIEDISSLDSLKRLKIIYADNSKLTKTSIENILNKTNTTLVVFRTQELTDWWNLLDEKWKNIFRKIKGFTDKPTKEQLQQTTEIQELDLKEYQGINELKPVEMLVNLKVLKFSDTDIMSLVSLKNLNNLTELHCARNPIQSLEPIKNLKNIEYLDCSNTRIDNLEAITNYKNIKTLKVSGTKIKNLNEIENLQSLKHLEFSSTDVRWLKPIKALKNLNTIKCYNTKIMKIFMDKYKEEEPNINILY